MPQMTLVQAINDALRTEMRRDPTVIVMGEDVGVNGGVFRATESLYKEFGPDRAIDTPLAESGIVGTAIGLALNGLKPSQRFSLTGLWHRHLIRSSRTLRENRLALARGDFTSPSSFVCPTAATSAPSNITRKPRKPTMCIPGVKSRHSVKSLRCQRALDRGDQRP
jgi:pyruvate dehydrogenase E1 component beta subunit